MSTTKERRKSPRIQAEHLVSYAHFDEHEEPDDMGMARTLDLSEGGMVLEMTRPQGVGERIRVKMITGDQILEADATVVYSKRLPAERWRVGVSFTEIPKEDEVTIAREVARFRESGGRG